MMNCSTERQQRLKRWAPKTTSGCVTCRKRRVKCDEARPICYACTRLNRTCVYSGLARGNPDCSVRFSRRQSDHICRGLSTGLATSEEMFYLDVYCKTIAPWLSTYSDAVFFEQVLPLWSSQDQAIKHALVAVAIAGEEQYLRKNGVRQHRRIWHYDQALKHMYMPRASVDGIMLACVVLWLHDNIIEDTSAATLHIKGFLRMILAYERNRTPPGIGKNLECTIWRGLAHWGQRAQPCFETRLGEEAVLSIRQKLKKPRLGQLCQKTTSSSADALIFVSSVAWACDKDPRDGVHASNDTFKELRSFLDSWYTTTLLGLNEGSDDCTILQCHYTIMSLIIRAQERSNNGEGASLLDDMEGLHAYENMLTSLESISIDSRIQQPGKRDLFLPIVPLALEAERIAPSVQHKLRIEAFLRGVKRVESFWSTNVVAEMIDAVVAE